MKKIIAFILVLIFALSVASSETLFTLKDVQNKLLNTDPRELLYGPDVYVVLDGTVAEVRSVKDEWYIYRIECDEENATRSILFGYEKPCFFIFGFDLSVGDKVHVEGELNIVYSSYATPFLGQTQVTILEN